MRPNPVALIALVGIGLACPAAAEPEVIARIDISAPHVLGVSGIEITEDGTEFIAVSDAGWFLTGTIDRKDGIPVNGEVTSVLPIIGQNGFPVRARRVGDWSDAEGLALLPDGTFFVSFERWARVARHEDFTSVGEWIKDHPDFRQYDDNRQLEAVAVDDAGRAYTLPEAPDAAGDFTVFRLEPDGWAAFTRIPGRDAFLTVGADFGPDGLFYLLERKLVFATWWQSRIRRFNFDTGKEETLWETKPNEMGNLEGISVWQAADGLRATLVSDNNGRENVPTEIVELRLTD